MRGKVVCFIAPATFLTSLGLIDAAITRTRAVVSSVAGSATSVVSRTDGSPKVPNRIARIICSFRQPLPDEKNRYPPEARKPAAADAMLPRSESMEGVLPDGIADIELFCTVVQAGGISSAALASGSSP